VSIGIDEIRRRAHAVIDALNRRDFEAIEAMGVFPPDGEFHSALAVAEGDVFRGVDGLRKWARAADETWADYSVEILRIEPMGGNRAVAEFRNTGRARASGVPLDMRTGQIWTFTDEGLWTRNETFTDAREAFELAGVPYE
jgi:ketosteroid isomerase-like protein